MATHLRVLAALLFFHLVAGEISVSAAGEVSLVGETVHDMLPQYGLPRGLLPESVKSYSLTGNGEFEVELSAPCYVQFTDLVYYEKKIKGKLTYGSISDLEGIQVKKLFAWLTLSGIVANPDKGTVEFKVGFLFETLPVGLFAEVPKCRKKGGCRGVAGVIPESFPLSEV